MADTFNTDFTIQLFPKAPEQVPIRETIERVAGRMLGTERAEIDALQATVGDESSGLVKATDDLEAKVGDYTPAEFSNRTITELLQTQGFVQKLEVMATRDDDIYEELNNKILNDPIINPTGIGYASHVIQVTADESPVTAITLTAIQPGTAGNSLSVRLANSSASDVTVDDNDIRIRVNGVLTVSQLYNKLVATKAVTDLVTVTLSDLPFISLLSSFVEIVPEENFTGGTDGTAALTSTSEELDATVDKSPTAGAPTIAQAYASAVLTAVATNPTEGDTVTVNDVTYTYVDALTEAYASATYTTDNFVPVDGATVVVNDQTYRFKDSPEQINDVKIAVTADGSLDNLKSAINTGYVEDVTFLGTVAATGVTASEVANHAITVTADAKGIAGNAYLKSASSDPDSHIDVDAGGDGTTFSGGVAAVANEIVIAPAIADTMVNTKKAINGEATEGTNYSTGTEQPTDVTATIDGLVVTCIATTGGTGGNAYLKAVSMATSDIAWDGTTDFFTGGLDITVGKAGAMRYDDDTVWISTDASAVDDSYWKRLPLFNAAPLVINSDTGSSNYTLDKHTQYVLIAMLENVGGDPLGIDLPAATGSGVEYRIANKHASDSFDIVAANGDVIDADTTISLTPYTSCILVDVADGMWAQF